LTARIGIHNNGRQIAVKHLPRERRRLVAKAGGGEFEPLLKGSI